MLSSLSGILLTAVVFIVIITVSVVIHELAHYFNARSVGVPVRAFSVGMGPIIWRKQWRGTEWRLSALPLGGYVDLQGLAPEQGEDGELYYPDEGFMKKSFLQKFWVLIGGVIANFILAILLISIAITAAPLAAFSQIILGELPPNSGALFQEVVPDSPAEALGIEPGDIVLSINGTQNPDIEQVRNAIQNASQLSLALRRDGETVNIQTPWPLEGAETPLLGVALAPLEVEPISYGTSLVETTSFLVSIVPESVSGIASGFGSALSGQRSETVAGPVGIVAATGQAARGGLIPVLFFAGIINFSLGLFNALPIPGLDGGRILLSGIVALRGKPFKPGQEEFVNFLGIALLMFFVVLITFGEVGDLIGIGQ